MAGVNVEIESLVKIRYGLNKLQNVADKGLTNSEKSLSSTESEIKAVYQRGCAKASQLESEIARLEREADAQQAEYDRQVRAAEEAKSEGRPYTLPYYSPDRMIEQAEAMKTQLKELRIALEELLQHKKNYVISRDSFLTEFRKIAHNSGGGDGEMDNVLQRSISALDDYVHTNVSSESSSAYDNYATQMRESNARNQENARRVTEENIRTLRYGED